MIKDAVKLSEIEVAMEAGELSSLMYPAEYAVSDLPRVNLTADQFEMARVGKNLLRMIGLQMKLLTALSLSLIKVNFY